MNKVKSFYRSAKELVKNSKQRVAGVALLGFTGAATAPAFAGGSAGDAMATAFSTSVTANSGVLWTIGGVILGVCAIVFIILRAKRVSGG